MFDCIWSFNLSKDEISSPNAEGFEILVMHRDELWGEKYCKEWDYTFLIVALMQNNHNGY